MDILILRYAEVQSAPLIAIMYIKSSRDHLAYSLHQQASCVSSEAVH